MTTDHIGMTRLGLRPCDVKEPCAYGDRTQEQSREDR
jgi:hypothetical protein